MLKIQFVGASQTVTGSCYLVTTDKSKFLIDCGMFQGVDVAMRNYDEFPFNPKDIDFVVLTHAHIDHIGLVPKLIRAGFTGPIFATNPTVRFAYHMLLDAAKIQEINVQRGISKGLLYDTRDALQAIEQLQSKGFAQEFIHNGVKLTYENVGHVLGAASVKLEADGKILYFSGDIGRRAHPFLQGFDLEKRQTDYVVMESLYGGKYHNQYEETFKKFVDAVIKTINRNGNVIIPAFALQRTQEILYVLKNAYMDNLIGKNVPVYMDSPLASNITFEYTQSSFVDNLGGAELFEFENLRFVKNSKKVLKKIKAPSIILAGSGMCEGGRILGHLINSLPNQNNLLAIVGFQAEGTLGRTLVEKPRKVIINKKEVSVQAEIEEFYGFSAHADQKDLEDWLNRFDRSRLKRVFLTHAEQDQSSAFMETANIQDLAYVPAVREEVILN